MLINTIKQNIYYFNLSTLPKNCLNEIYQHLDHIDIENLLKVSKSLRKVLLPISWETRDLSQLDDKYQFKQLNKNRHYIKQLILFEYKDVSFLKIDFLNLTNYYTSLMVYQQLITHFGFRPNGLYIAPDYEQLINQIGLGYDKLFESMQYLIIYLKESQINHFFQFIPPCLTWLSLHIVEKDNDDWKLSNINHLKYLELNIELNNKFQIKYTINTYFFNLLSLKISNYHPGLITLNFINFPKLKQLEIGLISKIDFKGKTVLHCLTLNSVKVEQLDFNVFTNLRCLVIKSSEIKGRLMHSILQIKSLNLIWLETRRYFNSHILEDYYPTFKMNLLNLKLDSFVLDSSFLKLLLYLCTKLQTLSLTYCDFHSDNVKLNDLAKNKYMLNLTALKVNNGSPKMQMVINLLVYLCPNLEKLEISRYFNIPEQLPLINKFKIIYL